MVNWKNVQYANTAGLVDSIRANNADAAKAKQDMITSLQDAGTTFSDQQTDAFNSAIQMAQNEDEVAQLMANRDSSWLNMGNVNAAVQDRNVEFRDVAKHEDALATNLQAREQVKQTMGIAEERRGVELLQLGLDANATEQEIADMKQLHEIKAEQRTPLLKKLGLANDATNREILAAKQKYNFNNKNNPLLIADLISQTKFREQQTTDLKLDNAIKTEQKPYLLEKLKLDNKATDQEILAAVQTYNFNNKMNPLKLDKYLVNINQEKLTLSRDEIKKTAEVTQVNRENFVNAGLSGLTQNNNYQNPDILKQLTQGALATGVKDTAFYDQLNAYKLDHLRTTAPKFDLGSTDTTEQDFMEGIRSINKAAASFPGADTKARKMFVDQLMEDSGLTTIKSRLDASRDFTKWKQEKAIETVNKILVEKAKKKITGTSSVLPKSMTKGDAQAYVTSAYGDTISDSFWDIATGPGNHMLGVLDKFFDNPGKFPEGHANVGQNRKAFTTKERDIARGILIPLLRFDETGWNEFSQGAQLEDAGGPNFQFWDFLNMPENESTIEDLTPEAWYTLLEGNLFERLDKKSKKKTTVKSLMESYSK
jgi:hypothetical protein